jgi:hypothetical protein
MSPDEVFWVGAKGGLVREKHRKAMGDALWLFMWFLLRQTSVSETGEGIVNYGHPQKRSSISRATGFPQWKIKKWMVVLLAKKYIRTEEFNPHGLVIYVQKAKQKNRRPGADQDRVKHRPGADQDRVPNWKSPYYRDSTRVEVYQKSSIPKDLSYSNKDAAAKSAAVENLSPVVQNLPREKSKAEIEERVRLLRIQAESLKGKYAN